MSLERWLIEIIEDYAVHQYYCICSQLREGRPTGDGGHEKLYGYGKQAKWYQKNDEPPCTCGLSDVLKKMKNISSNNDLSTIKEK